MLKSESVKLPSHIMKAARSAAKQRGCFVYKIFEEALTLYLAKSLTPVTNPNEVGGSRERAERNAARR